MRDLITISSSVLPDSARVVGFHGTEAISRPYEFEIFLALHNEPGEEFDLADAIGAKARLVIDRASEKIPPFFFAGILASVELMHASDHRLLVRAVLVPRLWQLGLSRHSRIFTKKKVPDIIKAVLEDNGISDYVLRLGAYEVEEHVCQYRESDLDFISRWMEREGIYYFFEHGEDGEKLVLCDKKPYDADPMGTPVRYWPQMGQDLSAGPSFRSFTCRHTALPATVRLKDYDYAKPGLNVSGSAPVSPSGSAEVSLYGERFFTPAAGERLARTRAEELLARQVVYQGVGGRLHLRPGYAFEVEEHPLASFNTRYVTVEAHHHGNQMGTDSNFRERMKLVHDDVYLVELSAIPAGTQFRAESRAPWPRIYGYENGTVDGAAESDYAQIDDQGRYNAKFKFDESNLKGGKATCWVRMMQPHGGDIEGFHFPLRKGTEVVFSFLGGDPDRPVISGVVPNAVNPSPVTMANYTRNVIQTGARNRLEIEDKAGNEWIRLSTPYAGTFINMGLAWPMHELNANTQYNAAITAQAAFDIAVGNPEPPPSGAGNMTVHVLNNLITTVDNVDMKTTVSSGNAYHTVASGTFTELVQSDVRFTYNATKTEHVDNGSVTETFQSQKTTIATTQEVSTGTTMTITSGALHTVNSNASYEHSITGHTKIDTTGGNTEILTTGTTHLHSDGKIDIDSPADITIHGSKVSLVADEKEHFTMGSNYELTIGANATAKLAAEANLTVGAFLEISCALNLALTFGARLELDFAEVFSLAPFHHEIKAAKFRTVAADIYTTPTHTRMGAMFSHVAGLFAVV
jgi:type VI secretion system secreted protein VgrG